MRLPSYQDLTKQQDKILQIPLDQSCLITGPPGSGKTVMALYRARRLAEKEISPEILMYNRLLSHYTASAAQELDVAAGVRTFHSWFYNWYWRNFKSRVPEYEKWRYNWDEILGAVNAPGNQITRTHHLIVDEGQDLHRCFFMLLRLICEKFCVCADENQQICEDNSTIRDIKQCSGLDDECCYTLTKNHRNTFEIAKLSAYFYCGLSTGICELPSRKGPLPEIQRLAGIEESAKVIARFATAHPNMEIGVFTHTKQTLLDYQRHLKKLYKGKLQKYHSRNRAEDRQEAVEFDKPGIMLVCHPSTKGLEFDAVFITEIQRLRVSDNTDRIKMLLYVMSSRARQNLYFHYTGANEPSILRIFPSRVSGLLKW